MKNPYFGDFTDSVFIIIVVVASPFIGATSTSTFMDHKFIMLFAIILFNFTAAKIKVVVIILITATAVNILSFIVNSSTFMIDPW